MPVFNRYNELPDSMPNKEFALVKVGDGFKWYVGDENNLPVPVSREVPAPTDPSHAVNKQYVDDRNPPIMVVTPTEMQNIEGSTDITQDPTVYLIKNE